MEFTATRYLVQIPSKQIHNVCKLFVTTFPGSAIDKDPHLGMYDKLIGIIYMPVKDSTLPSMWIRHKAPSVFIHQHLSHWDDIATLPLINQPITEYWSNQPEPDAS